MEPLPDIELADAGTDPRRWAYATLPKHFISKPDFTTAGPWSLFWLLEVRVAHCVRRARGGSIPERAGADGVEHRHLQPDLDGFSRTLHGAGGLEFSLQLINAEHAR